jgi:hypothetical protein
LRIAYRFDCQGFSSSRQQPQTHLVQIYSRQCGVAAGLIMLAALVGVTMLNAGIRKKRVAGALTGIHARLAVSGFVILAAYVFAG